jgi:hypothetical protein
MKPRSRFAHVTAETCGDSARRRCRARGRRARVAATPVAHQGWRARKILAGASALLTRGRAPSAGALPSAASQQSRVGEVKVGIARFGDPDHDAVTLADLDPLTGIFNTILSELEASGELLPEDLVAAPDRPAAAGKSFPTH